MMALPAAQAPKDPQKQTVSSLMIIRMMLDYAKNVDEAIALFEKFNIDFQGGPPLHYFIIDRSGKSAVVEFVDQNISVLPNTHPWHVATNFSGIMLEIQKSVGNAGESGRYVHSFEITIPSQRCLSGKHHLVGRLRYILFGLPGRYGKKV